MHCPTYPSRSCNDTGDIRGASSLLWTLEDSRKLFTDAKLWPSFIGTSLNNDRHEAGRFPVLVWPEQKRHLPSSLTAKRERSKSLKRKRGEGKEKVVDESSTISASSTLMKENEEDRKVKKVRTSWWGLNGGLRGLWGALVDWVGGSKGNDSGDAPKLSATSDEGTESLAYESSTSDNVQQLVANSKRTAYPVGADATSLAGARELVFNDLHSPSGCRERWEKRKNDGARGYMVGPGEVYGGDYSVYASDDPSRSHSIATVRVVASSPEDSRVKVSVKDLVAFCRVQNQVGKAAVFAFPVQNQRNPTTDILETKNHVTITSDSCYDVKYVAFTFAGVGDRY